MWSDGFECNHCKNNMGSVWAYTITLLLGNVTKTYPIVIGTSKCNHNHVHAKLLTDLKEWVDQIRSVYSRTIDNIIKIVI